MALLILAAVIGIPLVEIMVFIKVGSEIGALNTILITVVTAVIGAALLRIQGVGVLMRARAALERRETPVHEIFEGIFLAIAGLFLLIPGFVTDAIGFLLFLPPLRRALAGYVASRTRFVAVNRGAGGRGPRGGASSAGGGPIIDGDYEVIEPDAKSLNDRNRSNGGDGPHGPGNADSPWAKNK